MSARIQDAIPDPAVPAAREDALDDPADATEDLANELTSELHPAPRLVRTSAPLNGHAAAASEPAAPAQPIAVGGVLRERYVLEREIAIGGTAVVYRALDMRRDSGAAGGARVAVKMLRPELRARPHHVKRLQREFRQTQSLPHPNIVRFHDLDCERGTWFIVMELLQGETLGPRLRRSAPLPMPLDEVRRIVAQAGAALAFAHGRGVVHGDVKPDNVFITASGAVRLLDFGVAPEPARDDHPDEGFAAAATRAYASPEVLAGERPEPRDDAFSLACVVYEMLTGRHPWHRQGSDVARASGVRLEPPASLSTPEWRALSAALAWSRAERPDLDTLVEALTHPPEPQPARPAGVPVAVPMAVPAAAPSVPSRIPRSGFAWLLDWRIAAAAVLAFALGYALSRPDAEDALAARADAAAPVAAAAAPPRETAAVALDLQPIASAQAAEPEPLVPEPAPAAAAKPPGFVAFESGTMTVSSRAVVAAIPVRHFAGDRRTAEVGWRVLDGSAVMGRDIGGPDSGVARFAEGHTFRMIFVPITVDPRASGERTFAVELTEVSPGTAIGNLRRIQVTIVDDA